MSDGREKEVTEEASSGGSEPVEEDGEYSGHSSAIGTPLETSQELPILKEWNSLINVLARIPVKAQKGLSTFDLKLTCIATIGDEILVFGTNIGILYWYNRSTDELERLRCEGIETVTCVSCISTVDYMVAAGNQIGLVTIFQIPKKGPSKDRNKESQRFHIKDLHKGAITTLEWSKNGMRLFSGDQTGHVVFTAIDFDLVQIRSSVLLCENYEIIQLGYYRKCLLICSTFRSIIYCLENKTYNKVGSLERKINGKFGGLILSSAWEESPKVYSVRPGGRLWVADLSGVVHHTIKFKELILSQSQAEIHVIKPLKNARQLSQDVQFTRLFRFMKDYLVTYYKDILHIVDARNTIVLGICKELRSVLDVAVNKDEIFVLESSRNVIRLSAKPDKFSNLNFNLVSSTSSTFFSPSNNGLSSSGNFHSQSQQQETSGSPNVTDFSAGIKHLPDIMSASISDFRFPQEPMNFLASKFKETSEKVIPKINPLLHTIKTVIEADVDIEDGQKLIEGGLPYPVTPIETGDIPEMDSPMTPEEPVFVPEPERFQKISTLPFEDVVVESKTKTTRKAKKMSRNGTKSKSDGASDTISVSSAYSSTSGSDSNANIAVGLKMSTNEEGNISSLSTVSNFRRKLSNATLSSSNSTGSDVMSISDHPHVLPKNQQSTSFALSQSFSLGSLVPNKAVTKEELNLKEELLARRLMWPELLPDSVSADVLFDELLESSGTEVDSSPAENNYWQVNLPHSSTSTASSRSDRSSTITLVGLKQSADETTDDDTDSKTVSMENGSSFGNEMERMVGKLSGNSGPSIQTNLVGSDEDDDDKYYMDIYTRYRNKDSISSYNSVLSFGPPSGSSYVSTGAGAFASSLNANVYNDNNVKENAIPSEQPSSSNSPRQENTMINEEEPSTPKEASNDTFSSSSTVEELDSIVESKIVTDEYWRKWRLPAAITQISVCEHYIMCIGNKGNVYYAKLDGITLQWKMLNYSASTIVASPCGAVVWRIYRGDLYSLTNPSGPEGPIGIGGEEWSRLTQKKDVLNITVHRSFGWVVRCDGSLEFCTGLLETRLVPYFEKVYTPWPMQEVVCCGHRLWGLTSDGRIVLRTGTSDLNPKGIDWLEIRWNSSTNIPPICSISYGEIREDGLYSVWFSDTSGNLYFTYEESDSKGIWIPWKVSGGNSIIPQNGEIGCQSKSVILSSIRDHVSKSLKSLILQGSNDAVKLCSSKHSVWFVTTGTSVIYGNRNTVTGHYWKPLRVDRGITIPSTWSNIFANSVYRSHGKLWISDSKGSLFHLSPTGGKLQQTDLPIFTDGKIVSIAPAPEALWALTSTGDIHGRCGITTNDPVGKGWRQISISTLKSVHFVHISCGSEVAWAVDDRGDIYMRIGNLKPPGAQDMSPAWNKVESSLCCKGVFTKVYVGANDSMVWALDDKQRVYARQAVFPDYPIGTGWLLVKGVNTIMLSISDSAVWALSSSNDIYRRHGITKTNFVGDYWRKIPGNALAITVSLCDELWALSSEGYLLKHSKKVMKLKGWSSIGQTGGNSAAKAILDDEYADWELVDNTEI